MKLLKKFVLMLMTLLLCFTNTISTNLVVAETESNEDSTFSATYEFVLDGDGELPNEVLSLLPETKTELHNGDVIKNEPLNDVELENSTFKFLKWSNDEYTIDNADVHFVGTWQKLTINLDDEQSETTLDDEINETVETVINDSDVDLEYIDTEVIVEDETSDDQENIQDDEELKDYELVDESSDGVVNELDTSLLDGIDFNSKRLIVASDEQLEDEHIISSYDGLYLLQYASIEDAQAAYLFYLDKAEFVEPDVEVIATEGEPEIESHEETELTQEENAFVELEKELEKGEVFEETKDARQIVVALLDTGAREDSHVIGRVSMLGDDINDNNGHGNNMLDYMISVNSDIKVLSVKVLDDDARGNISNVIAGIEYAIEHGVDIINLSLTARNTKENSVLKDYVIKAVEKGIKVVASAGNDSKNTKYFTPANVEEAYVIASLNANGDYSSLSNYGDTVDYGYLNAKSTSEASAKFSALLAKEKDAKLVHDTYKEVIKPFEKVVENEEEPTGTDEFVSTEARPIEPSFFTNRSELVLVNPKPFADVQLGPEKTGTESVTYHNVGTYGGKPVGCKVTASRHGSASYRFGLDWTDGFMVVGGLVDFTFEFFYEDAPDTFIDMSEGFFAFGSLGDDRGRNHEREFVGKEGTGLVYVSSNPETAVVEKQFPAYDGPMWGGADPGSFVDNYYDDSYAKSTVWIGMEGASNTFKLYTKEADWQNDGGASWQYRFWFSPMTYKANVVNVTINYLEEGTNKVLARQYKNSFYGGDTFEVLKKDIKWTADKNRYEYVRNTVDGTAENLVADDSKVSGKTVKFSDLTVNLYYKYNPAPNPSPANEPVKWIKEGNNLVKENTVEKGDSMTYKLTYEMPDWFKTANGDTSKYKDPYSFLSFNDTLNKCLQVESLTLIGGDKNNPLATWTLSANDLSKNSSKETDFGTFWFVKNSNQIGFDFAESWLNWVNIYDKTTYELDVKVKVLNTAPAKFTNEFKMFVDSTTKTSNKVTTNVGQPVKLTIQYLEKGTNKVLATQYGPTEYESGDKYSVKSPSINNYYLSDDKQATVAGTITEDTLIKVYYEPYVKLTIQYLEKGTDKVLATQHGPEQFKSGSNYSVKSPSVKNYYLSDDKQSTVAGTITKDTLVKVYYEPYVNLTINYLEKGTDKVLATKYGPQQYKSGASYSIKSPNVDNYYLVDSKQATVAGTITKNTVIDVYYEPYHKVTTSLTPKGTGTITPTDLKVKHGGTKEVTWEPDETHYIEQVKIDGIPNPNPNPRGDKVTFKDIKEDHDVQVVTAPYLRITTEVINGTIDPNIEKIMKGEDKEVKYEPKSEEYLLSEIIVDGENVDINLTPDKYPFNDMQENHHIKVVYEKQEAPVKSVKNDEGEDIHTKFVNVGANLNYTIAVTNPTEADLEYTVTDYIPQMSELVSIEDGGRNENGQIIWDITVPAKETMEVHFTVKTIEKAAFIQNKAEQTVHQFNKDYTLPSNPVYNITPEPPVKQAKDMQGNDIAKMFQRAGEEIVFDVNFINNSPLVEEFKITDRLPEGVEFVSATDNGVYEDGVVTWFVTMQPNQNKTVSVTVRILEDAKGTTVINTARQYVDDSDVESNYVPVPVIEDPDKRVYQDDEDVNGLYVNNGSLLTYVVSFKNTADEPKEFVITDAIDEHLENITNISDDGVLEDGVITWTLTLEALEEKDVSFDATIIGDAIVAKNKANVSVDDINLETPTVINFTPEPPVKIITDEKGVIINGEYQLADTIIVFPIEIKNITDVAKQFIITDELDTRLEILDISDDGQLHDNIAIWELTLEALEEKTLYVKARITENAKDSIIANDVIQVSDKSNTSVVDIPDIPVLLEPTKKVLNENLEDINNANVLKGTKLIYELQVHNCYTEEKEFTFVDELADTGIKLIRVNDGGKEDNGVITWTKTLQPDETWTVSYEVETTMFGVYIPNEADVYVDKITTKTNLVENWVPLEPVKTVQDKHGNDVDQMYMGNKQLLHYTITWENIRDVEQSITITDIVPENTEFVSADNGGVMKNGVITWPNLVVDPESKITVSFDVRTIGHDKYIPNTATLIIHPENQPSVKIDSNTVENWTINLGTKAYVKESGNQHILPDGVIHIVDIVEYEHLTPGVEYVAKGKLYDIDTKELLAEGIATFTPESDSGNTEVEFSVNVDFMDKHILSVYEQIYMMSNDSAGDSTLVFVGDHNEDLKDEDEMVFIDSLYRAAMVLYKIGSNNTNIKLNGAYFNAKVKRERFGKEIIEDLGNFVTGGIYHDSDQEFTFIVASDPACEKVVNTYTSTYNDKLEKHVVAALDLEPGIYYGKVNGSEEVNKYYVAEGTIFLPDMIEDADIIYTELIAPEGYRLDNGEYSYNVGHDYSVNKIENYRNNWKIVRHVPDTSAK